MYRMIRWHVEEWNEELPLIREIIQSRTSDADLHDGFSVRGLVQLAEILKAANSKGGNP